MRKIHGAVATAFLFTSVLAFAHHGDKNGPCSSYEATCKSDASVTGAADKGAKRKAMHECVKTAAAADTANGPACTTAMEKHHKGTHEKGAAAPEGTAN